MLQGTSSKKLETTCREKRLSSSPCISLPLKIHHELGQQKKKETEELQQEINSSGSFVLWD